MGTEQMTLAAMVLAPVVILGIVGMIRGYHMTLKVWKHNSREGDNHGDQ
jgi:hypothetical protein